MPGNRFTCQFHHFDTEHNRAPARCQIRNILQNHFAFRRVIRQNNALCSLCVLCELGGEIIAKADSACPKQAKRSQDFFSADGVAGLTRRAFTTSMGFEPADMSRPLIGICNTYSELNHCNSHLRAVCEAVKRGVLQAGGFPLEFPTISLGEVYLSPTSMLCRNLAAMDTEEMIRGNPLAGVVLLTNCDKTTPAALMGAASADLPTIMVSGGPMLNGHFQGEILGACTDCRRYTAEYQAGTISAETYKGVEQNLVRSAGHCMVMGTASTMNSLMEALGMALPGNGATPASDSRRLQLAQAAGRQIVRLVEG